jgi:uncharacterized Zn-binding protein involved in type VI secretion
MVTPGLPPVPHIGGPVVGPCSPNVLTGNLPQARVTDMCMCVGPPDVIVSGSPTVLVNGLPAARVTDLTSHGGTIIVGFPTVLIGAVGGGGGGGGGGGSWADTKPEISLEMSRDFLDDEAERSLSVEFWSSEEYGLSGAFKYDLDKSAISLELSHEYEASAFKRDASYASADGAISATGTVKVATVATEASLVVFAEPDQVGAAFDAGGELMAVKGEVSGQVRLTPKSIWSRLTGVELSDRWDKGIILSGTGEAGIGAAAKVSGEASIKPGVITLEFEAKAGFGAMLGGGIKINAVY